jgi:hypothetical protein
MSGQPDPQPVSAERIEALQRRRTRLMWMQGLFFLIWQANFFAFDEQPAGDGPVGHVKVSAYVVWAIVLLAFIATGGGYLQSRQVRAILNDESTVEHRRTAMVTGYWVTMMAAIGAYLASLFRPLTAGEVIHIVLTAGVAAALINFAVLERRAQAND